MAFWALHKPRGVVTSTVREGGASHVFELLPEEARGAFAVGRLDKNSEGLLLFSSDAKLAQALMDPGALAKEYLVTVEGFPGAETLEALRRGGMEIDRRRTRPCEVERLGKAPRGGTRLRIVLHEGLNRQIRRMLAAHGHEVRRLVRTRVGPVALGELPAGATRALTDDETAALLGAAAS